jgi:UDP-N-acetylmuramoyl-tripeptide--D-alanyl-D-alanine ligase
MGNVSDPSGPSDRTYRKVYQAARSVADQVIFVGEHSHRSNATAEDIANGRFLRFEHVRDVAEFLKESAIPGEIILLKSSARLLLERLMLAFFTSVRCWQDACGRNETCVPIYGAGCALYEAPFDQHEALSKGLVYPLPTVHFG